VSDGGRTHDPDVVVVGVALLDGDGRLLAARRSAPSALAGGWEFPGGKVEPGEGDEAALHREVREELGVAIALGDRIGGDWPLKEGWVLRLWTGRVVEGVPRPLEDHDELRWLVPGDWGSVAWLPADWPIVAALASALGVAAPRPPSS
jgi:8-oxo-dGTP diphosphatase